MGIHCRRAVRFFPTDGKGTPVGTDIVNGADRTALCSGKYKVCITAMKVVGKEKVHPGDPTSEEQDTLKQYIPKEYNDETSLSYEVSGAGKQDFTLKSAAAP